MSSAFSYQSDLPHQLAPVEAIAALFDGLAHRPTGYSLNEDIIANADAWDDLGDELLEENLLRVQQAHNEAHPHARVDTGRVQRDDGAMLDGVSVDAHSCPHFSVEMETGTGKTYVYLRTMLALYHRYGFTKFIVVVPSVAILEGVKKSVADTREHFNGVFGVTNFTALVYDGAKPGVVAAFARSTFPTLLIMTVQSFTRASNNIYKATDKIISDLRPYQWIQQTRPIIILDEPQKMSSGNAKAAVRTLKPLFVLRYSATHRADDRPNTIYRLTPAQAFRLGLVKQVQVTGISDLGFTSTPSLELREVTLNPIRARIRARCLDPDGQTRVREIVLAPNDQVFARTQLAEHKGLKVANIRADGAGLSAAVELEGGPEGGFTLGGGASLQGVSEEAWGAQIEETIRVHFERQRQLRPLGVKVLSLFFIDRVANYTAENGRIRRLFDEAFNRLKADEPEFAHLAAEEVREAYFAARKEKRKGAADVMVAVDEPKEDSDEFRQAFELIMQKKETLLSFPNATDPGRRVAFIFAHSALQEGWDNPNVFQICTLNQTVSTMKKRQEIGRGLRLCVRREGERFERVTDPEINVLTVIANESYETYVRTLQSEYAQAGDDLPPKPKRPRETTARRRDQHFEDKSFRAFWDKLCQRLEYTIDVDTSALITECVEQLNDPVRTTFPAPMIALTRGRFVMVEYAIQLVKSLGAGRAQLRVRRFSTEVEALTRGLVPPTDHLVNVEQGSDLAKLSGLPHLRGFKVMIIDRAFGEHRVTFTNEVEITESAQHTFGTTQLDDIGTETRAVHAIERPLPDIIGRAADETHLTRATLRAIFDQVTDAQKQHLHAHPEGWANVFVRVVRELTRDHIVDRLRFRDTGGRYTPFEDLEAMFPEVTNPVQREVVEGGAASLYDKVQVDSEVERTFIRDRLIPDHDKLCLYFKFPAKFRIDLPRVIGNYNPDWGILRKSEDGRFTLELVRETKGADDLEKLRFLNEGRKLVLAQRYFATLGIDYRFVSPEIDRYWESRAEAARSTQRQLKVVKGRAPADHIAVPVYNLKAAATAFSTGQEPRPIGSVALPKRQARRPGLFIAKVIGSSMDRVAADGAWCLWQHVGAPGASAPLPGELLVIRRADPGDPGLGEFTFKRWAQRGRSFRLEPVSTDPRFQALSLEQASDDDLRFIARFVEVLDIDEAQVV